MKYKSRLATAGHKPVTKMSQFGGRWDGFEMGFYLRNEVIGGGELTRVRYHGVTSKDLQTESVALNKKFRKKGHGIHLYIHLIAQAQNCGARRIYSSRSLNKFSKRMWSEKLAKIFNVKEAATRKPCSECNSVSRRVIGYYIQLKGK